MNIAVNTRFLSTEQPEGFGHYTREIFVRLARDHPQHQFYFLFDRPFNKKNIFPANVHTIVLPPPARHPVLWKYWFDIKLPFFLKKIKADAFISPDGFCSLTTSVAQTLVVHDLGFLHYPTAYQKSHLFFYRFFTPRFLKKAARIITVSEFSKKDIIAHYNVPSSKISIAGNGVRTGFRPLTSEIQQSIKEKHTEGKEFFLFVGTIQPRKNLTNLLKAFSIFKKRQQSSMKLVIAGRIGWKMDGFINSLASYKYRQDLVLTGYVEDEDLAKLTASAYALVYPSLFEGFGVPVIEAMACDVPVITSEKSAMEEIGKDAAIYFDPNDPADIADKMMRIYKDENYRLQLIVRGREIAKEHTWDRAAAAFAQSLTSLPKF